MKSPPQTATAPIRVIIADDHPVVRQGLAVILDSQKDIKIVGEAADGEEACELYNRLSPDVLMVDLRMPGKDGLQVVAEVVSNRTHKPRTIVMTTYESEQDIRRALSAGANGYIVKGAPPEQIRDAVRRVAKGESVLPTEIASKLAVSMAHPELSQRETQVLKQLALGKSNKEIGQALYISEGTVKHHVKAVFSKLKAICRTEAMSIAAQRGLI